MSKYVAFLRGINVGGHKPVAMDDLGRAFTSLGFGSVETHIQSGNVAFEAAGAARVALTRKIETAMRGLFGDEVAVFLRTFREIEEILNLDPFGGRKADARAKRYVTFVSRRPGSIPELPLFSPRRDVEIIAIRGCDLFSVSHPKDGRYGFPNAFIEKQFGVTATTRNWSTIVRIMG